jgi:hypothetical protein
MKIGLNKFFTVSFLLFAASAWADKWTIDAFDNSPDPGDPDKYLAAESGKGLTPVKPGQVSRQEGILYIRQKFEDDLGRPSYQIFRGKAKPAARNLGKISLEGIPYATLLKMKLFYKKNADSEDDLEGVYFDGNDIFVEGDDPIYINLNGKMEELRPIVFKEYDIEINSEPSEATVSVGNVNKGLTPAVFTVPSAKTIAVVVSKDGYYPIIRPVTPVDGRAAKENLSLTARAPLNNPAMAYRSQLDLAVKNKDASAIRNIRINIMQVLSSYNVEIKRAIDAILESFPANPSKAAKESPDDFNARRSLWTNMQNKEKDALNREAEGYFKDLKDLLAKIDVIIEELDFTLKYEYIPAFALEPTNLGIKDFSINTVHENFNVKFKYSNAKLAYGAIPRNEIAQNLDRVHGVLKLWNIPNENGDFASIYDIEFFYDETPLKILTKGSFTLGNATNASRATEKDLNARIAKYPGRVAWSKKDSVATLAALRAGASTVSSKPTSSYAQASDDDDDEYDEEEDDEEFEEGMENQRRADYSRSSASRSATDIFGNRDEYLFWSGVAFAVLAVSSGVIGFMENSKFQTANAAVNTADEKIGETIGKIRTSCEAANLANSYAVPNVDDCVNKWIKIASGEGDIDTSPTGEKIDALRRLYNNKDNNVIIRDSYNQSRIIWFTTAGLSAAVSITLFLW